MHEARTIQAGPRPSAALQLQNRFQNRKDRRVTVSVTVAVCVVDPLFAVIVTVEDPIAAEELAFSVSVDEPAPVIEAGLKVAVTPLGRPEADKVIAPENPPVTAVVTVTVPEPDRATLSDDGEALTEKPAVTAEVTVSETVVVSVIDPLVPVTVIEYVPAAAVEPTVKVSVELPDPVIEAGLNAAVTPVGNPLAVSVTAESKPPETVLVIVELPVLPAATETEAGEADSVYPGCVVVDPVSAARSPAFGEPQPVTRS